jgi:hypothetical protein
MFFNSLFSEISVPTISFLTAAPARYYNSWRPIFVKIDAHSSAETTSKPLNSTAPYSLAHFYIMAWFFTKYS